MQPPLSAFGAFKCSCLNRVFLSDLPAAPQVWRFKRTRYLSVGKKKHTHTASFHCFPVLRQRSRTVTKETSASARAPRWCCRRCAAQAQARGKIQRMMRYRKGPPGGRARRKRCEWEAGIGARGRRCRCCGSQQRLNPSQLAVKHRLTLDLSRAQAALWLDGQTGTNHAWSQSDINCGVHKITQGQGCIIWRSVRLTSCYSWWARRNDSNITVCVRACAAKSHDLCYSLRQKVNHSLTGYLLHLPSQQITKISSTNLRIKEVRRRKNQPHQVLKRCAFPFLVYVIIHFLHSEIWGWSQFDRYQDCFFLLFISLKYQICNSFSNLYVKRTWEYNIIYGE